jgi:hypothetical protein
LVVPASGEQDAVPESGEVLPASGVVFPASGVVFPASGVVVPESGVALPESGFDVPESVEGPESFDPPPLLLLFAAGEQAAMRIAVQKIVKFRMRIPSPASPLVMLNLLAVRRACRLIRRFPYRQCNRIPASARPS